MRRTNLEQIKFYRQENGITLLALVITIIILIVLSAIVINMTIGENGIIEKVDTAKDMDANSTQYKTDTIENLTTYLEEMNDSELTSELGAPTTVAEAKARGTRFIETTPLYDDLGNIVYIPGGFHFNRASDATKVEDGIVIEDDDGNQFVWIPTGEYQTTDPDEPTKTNALSRRGFYSSNTAPRVLSGDTSYNSYFYGEGDSRSVAYDSIGAFLNSAKPTSESEEGHGGFYIGRYEAGTEAERTSTNNTLSIPLVQANKSPYVYVTRDQAKQAAESLYRDNSEIKATSQLISSYAWDTTLNFICQNSDIGYTLAATSSSTYSNITTGEKTQTGGYSADCYSNIYDLIGNCREWTTEYYRNSSYSCVYRGGYYDGNYASYRGNNTSSFSETYISFRIQLYL